jgi:hypothetical protein
MTNKGEFMNEYEKRLNEYLMSKNEERIIGTVITLCIIAIALASVSLVFRTPL